MATRQTQPPNPQLVAFARGVIAALDCWPVLRLAVQESWGGPNSASKQRWIASSIVDAFQANPLDEEEVELLLLDALVEEFETEVDDGSSLSVARNIVDIWREVTANQMDLVLKLEGESQRLSSKKVQASRQVENGDDDSEDGDGDEDDENMADETVNNSEVMDPPTLRSNKPGRILDEDGFELVQKGRRGRE